MKTIIAQFALANEVAEPQPLKVGIINDSYILRAKKEGEVSYFLQKINHHIFRNVEGLQANIALVTEHIRKKLIASGEEDIERKVLQLVPTKEGKWYYESEEGAYWRMYVLIENISSPERVTPQSAYLAGIAFGRFQNQLADLDAEQLVESIPNFHNLPFRLQQLQEAVEGCKSDGERQARLESTQDILAAILARKEEMCIAERLWEEGKLPKRINHCDTKVNNMLFDEAGNPICIVDLDTVMPGFVLSDFGDFMRTAANTGEEDDKDLSRIHVDMEVYNAYKEGYLKEATFLTETEKELLAHGCKRMSYMQAIRFYTDYLNGDTYYKIAYKEHNLVRTRAQMRLLEEQERVL